MTTRPKSIIRILSDLHAGPANPAAEAAALIHRWSNDDCTPTLTGVYWQAGDEESCDCGLGAALTDGGGR